jgi:hypothetical protein
MNRSTDFTDREQRPATLLLAVGLFCAFVALDSGRLDCGDTATRLAVSRALWQEGTVFVRGPWSNTVETPHGTAAVYGIGQSLVLIPFDALGYAFGRAAGDVAPETRAKLERLPVVFLYGPLTGVLWWWLLACLAEESGAPAAWARAGACVFMLATIALPYVCQIFQEEALVGICVTAALLYAVRLGRTRRAGTAFATGLFAGLALLVRLNAVFALIPVAGCALDLLFAPGWSGRERLRSVAGAAAGLAIPAVLFGAFAWWRFSSPVATGYDLAFQQMQAQGHDPWRPVRPWVAAALLFGPGKGLFVLSPPLLLGLAGLFLVFRKHPLLWAGAVASFVASALFHSRIHADGPVSWGPRYQVHLIGVLVYPLVVGLRACLSRWPGRLAAGVAVSAGVAIQLLACMTPAGLEHAQASQRGDRAMLYMTAASGELTLRVNNVVRWATDTWPALPEGSRWHDEIAAMRTHYVPNLWGPVYAKRLGGRARAAVMASWLGLVVLALGCLLVGLRRSFARSPVPGPQKVPPAVSLPAAPAYQVD